MEDKAMAKLRSRLTDQEVWLGDWDFDLACDDCGAPATMVVKKNSSTASAFGLCADCAERIDGEEYDVLFTDLDRE
jgi:hypothetical protein